MPTPEECIERWKAEAQRDNDEIFALGGRPTRPIQQYPMHEATVVDGMAPYRDDYEKVEAIFEVDLGRVSTHWAEESDRLIGELDRWRNFKQAQQLRNQSGRTQFELELETTDVALNEALSKLSDWQDFQFVHQRRVHEAEKIHEHCQQGIARVHGAMVAASNADAALEPQEPNGRWMSYMRKAHEQLEASQKELMWVKSQWTEVIAEACSCIATAPKLQKQLEAKLETQTNAIYRCLQQEKARPSHAVYAPNINAELHQRTQHWILESSAFKTELWDWRNFMAWRRRLKDAGNMDQEGRKVLSESDSCAELFEDLVKYQEEEIDRATSWVNCWRRLARQYMEARKRRLRYNRPQWPAYEENDDDDEDEDEDEDDDFYNETEVAKAKKAGFYALHAEEKVSVAAKRLEEFKQKHRDILAESGPTPTAKHPAIQRLPTPPKSQSPESVPGSRRPSNGREPAGKGHRRSRRERARKEKAGMPNTNMEQHEIPPFSLGSNHLKEHDEIGMSDHAEEANQADPEGTVVSDVEDPPNYPPQSPPGSQPRPTADTNHGKLPSSTKAHRRSKKERTRNAKARMANINTEQHALPPFSLGPNHIKGHNDETEMLDHTEDINPVDVKKESNQADSENIAVSDVEDFSSHLPHPPPESQPRHTANKNHRKLPSSSSQSQTSRKTRSSTKLDQISSGKILKKSSKNKPGRKTKDFTDQKATALLDIALTSSSSTEPTSLGRKEPESNPKPAANTDHRALPLPSSPISTSRKTRSSTKLDQAASGKILKKSSKNKPLKKAKAFTGQQTIALLDAASTSYPSANTTSLGRNVPESYPEPTAETDRRESPALSSQTPTSSCPSIGSTSLGRDIPESYPKPTADIEPRELPASSSQIPTSSYTSTNATSLGSPKCIPGTNHHKSPSSSQPPMSSKTRVDQLPPGKILKKPSKNKPLKKAAKVFTEASTGPAPPRRSERLKKKALGALKRPV